jgi:hypothetical protein
LTGSVDSFLDGQQPIIAVSRNEGRFAEQLVVEDGPYGLKCARVAQVRNLTQSIVA